MPEPEEPNNLSEDHIKLIATWKEKHKRISVLNKKRWTLLIVFTLVDFTALFMQLLDYSTGEVTIGIIIMFLVIVMTYNIHISHKINNIIFDR